MEQIKDIDIKRLELNKGQVEGLPKNPRFIRDERYKALVKSIEDAPEMLKLRELLVVEHGSKFVVIGGNMRLRACKELGMETVPCKVLPADTPVAKLREYAIKDNNGFGEDDWDVLANEWDAEELQEWGMELPMDWVSPDEFGDEFSLPDGNKSELGTMTFVVTDKQRELINDCVGLATYSDDLELTDNKNTNGAGLYLIVAEWLKEQGQKQEKPLSELEKDVKELRQYLRNALAQSGRKASDVDKLLGTSGMSGHYFGESQWMFPTKSAYEQMATIMPLDRDWKECRLVVREYTKALALEKHKALA